MVDAVSLSGNSYRTGSSALEQRSVAAVAESRPAVAALSALTVSQPVTRVSTPSETAEEIGDLSFLYGPSGVSGPAALPAYAVSSAQSVSDESVAADRNPTARLAIGSNDLNALMSSFLTSRLPSANQVASPDVPAEIGSEQKARTDLQSVIKQVYSQF